MSAPARKAVGLVCACECRVYDVDVAHVHYMEYDTLYAECPGL